MRLSAEKDDTGFDAWQRALLSGHRVTVFLDGVEQKHCLTADEEEGFVLKRKLDEDGQPFADGDEIATETLHGVVRIVLTPKG